MPTFFSETQKSLVTAMLDRLIPRQGKHPGAGEVGVADYLDGAVIRIGQSPARILRRTHRRPGRRGHSRPRLRGPGPRYKGRSSALHRGQSLGFLSAPRNAHLQRVLHPPDRARISGTGRQTASAKRIRRRVRRPQRAGSRRTAGAGIPRRLTRVHSF